MKFACGTDRGLVREINEDSYYSSPSCEDTPCVFVIADGMGGHNCGEVASRTAVDYIGNGIAQDLVRFSSAESCGTELIKLVEGANYAVYQKSLEIPDANGMGTTLTILLMTKKTVTVAHVGDSRLYLVRSGNMKQVTTDHSYIEEMVRKGSLTRAEAERHPRKNIITRAVGCSLELEIDILSLMMEKDDIFILCTDGLTNMLRDDEIYETVLNNEPEAACKQLIDAAKKHGGEDNITVLVIKCE